MNGLEVRYDPIILGVIGWRDVELLLDVLDPQGSEENCSNDIDEERDCYERFYHDFFKNELIDGIICLSIIIILQD